MGAYHHDYATVKYGPDGQQLWVSRYDGLARGEDHPQGLVVDSNGDVIVTGRSDGWDATLGASTEADQLTLKYAGTNGALLWSRRYDGPDHSWDMAYAVVLDENNDVYVTGTSRQPANAQWDGVTAKYAGTSGIPQWLQRHAGDPNGTRVYLKIALGPSGTVCVAGYQGRTDVATSHDFAVTAYDRQGGQVRWNSQAFNGSNTKGDRVADLAVFGRKVFVTGEMDQGGNDRWATLCYTANGAPVANAGPDVVVAVPHDGDPATNTAAVVLTGSGSDPDADALNYQWRDVNGTVVGSSEILTQTLETGTYTYVLRVTDAYGATADDSIAVTVLPESNAARTAVAGPDQFVAPAHDGDPNTSMALVNLDGRGSSDPDGDPLTFAWRDQEGMLIATTAQHQLSLPPGVYAFTLRVADPYGDADENTLTVTVTAEANGAPVANAGVDQVFAAPKKGGPTPVTLKGGASLDPDGDPLTFAWYQNGTLLAIGAQPTVNFAPGRHRIVLTVTDPYGSTSTDVVYVQIGVANVTSEASMVVQSFQRVGKQNYTAQVRITNTSEGVLPAPLTLALDGLPKGVKVRRASGKTSKVTGSPTGSPLVGVSVAGLLVPGASATVSVEIVSKKVVPLSLPGTLRLLAGPGKR